MNNETNQNIVNNQLLNIGVTTNNTNTINNNQQIVQPINQNIIQSTQTTQPTTNQAQIKEQVQTQQNPSQPLTLQQAVQQTYQKQQQHPVDFNSLSPLEKEQLIEKAIKEAELKCKIAKPKGFTKLNFVCILMVLLCIACVIILNILK